MVDLGVRRRPCRGERSKRVQTQTHDSHGTAMMDCRETARGGGFGGSIDRPGSPSQSHGCRVWE